jgi:lipopolysaccharide biosynthesis glycosyltransferase
MRLSLIAASDENYAMALGVMVRSALENLRESVGVDLYVLGDGLSPRTQAKLEETWRPFPLRTHWLTPECSVVRGKTQSRGHAGVPATYFRLMLSDLIPDTVAQAIYLDVDMVVQGDLCELLDTDFDGAIVQAVPDAYTEYFHRGRLEHVDLPEELRFSRDLPYFNAGLMVIQLQQWRAQRVGERALQVATTYGGELAFHDQDALNLVLAGHWKALDPTWNLHELPQFLSAWEVEPYTQSQRRRVFFNPKVIHFVSAEKPWTSRCYDFYHAPKFHEVLSRTAWADWKPRPLRWPSYLLERLLIRPNIELNWCLWRGLIQASHPRIFRLLGRVILKSPWVVFTYPLWLLTSTKPSVPNPDRKEKR